TSAPDGVRRNLYSGLALGRIGARGLAGLRCGGILRLSRARGLLTGGSLYSMSCLNSLSLCHRSSGGSRRGRLPGKLLLLDALAEYNSEVAAGGIDDSSQALRGRIDE